MGANSGVLVMLWDCRGSGREREKEKEEEEYREHGSFFIPSLTVVLSLLWYIIYSVWYRITVSLALVCFSLPLPLCLSLLALLSHAQP